MRNERGFTLLETLIVVAIIGIMGAVAMGMIFHELPKYRLRDATMSLFADIQSARLHALRHGQSCSIEQDGNGYKITLQNGNVLKRVSLTAYPGVSFGSVDSSAADGDMGTFTGEKLTMYPNGMASEDRAFFLKSSRTPPDGNRISVNRVGRPRIEKWNGTAYL